MSTKYYYQHGLHNGDNLMPNGEAEYNRENKIWHVIFATVEEINITGCKSLAMRTQDILIVANLTLAKKTAHAKRDTICTDVDDGPMQNVLNVEIDFFLGGFVLYTETISTTLTNG